MNCDDEGWYIGEAPVTFWCSDGRDGGVPRLFGSGVSGASVKELMVGEGRVENELGRQPW